MHSNKSDTPPKGDEITLPVNRSYVVQIEEQTDMDEVSINGRVEHIVSGQSMRFHSLSELLRFIRHHLGKSKFE